MSDRTTSGSSSYQNAKLRSSARWFQDMPILLKLLSGFFVVGVLPFIVMSAAEIVRNGFMAPQHPNVAALYISLGLILSLVVAGFLANLIVRPLRALQQGIEALMAGSEVSLDLGRGDEIGRLAIAFDRLLTERHHAEASLRESETRLRAIIEHTTDAIYIKDLIGRYQLINPAGAAFLGRSIQEVLGKRDEELFTPDTGQQIQACDQQILSAGTAQTFEEPDVEMPDGMLRTYLTTKYPYRGDHGRIIGLIGISRDITERKREEEERAQLLVREQRAWAEAEAAKELNRLKSGFINSISHELRTPLTSILGYAEFMEDRIAGPLTPEQDQFVRQIQSSTRRLKHLVDDLLDSARMEAGTFSLTWEEVDFGDKVREIIGSLLPQAEEGGLRLEATLPSTPLMATFDPQRIEQVLINLINNAIKFTPAGGQIRVQACQVGNHLRCEIADTGIGIAPEAIPQLFQRFQSTRSGVRKEGGTGLGLSISKALVEAHGGSIGVESDPGRGSTFWFILPLRQPGAIQAETPLSATAS